MRNCTNTQLLRKMLIVLLLCSFIAGTFTACSDKKQSDGKTTFTVGFDAEFPPYGYKDESGEYVGFDLSLAEEVCRRNGWELVKQPIDWDSKDMELSSGSIDCIWNGFTMDGRESDYTWTTPYIDNSQVVIVKSDSSINSLSDLAGKVVVVQSDSSALAAFTGEDAEPENVALAKSFASLQQVGDYNGAFMNLEAGSVDAICMDMGVANYELNARGGRFRMLSQHVSNEQYGIGFKLGNTELRDKVQSTLLDMLDDGTFLSIAEEWGLEESICLSADNVVNDSDLAVDKGNFFVELGSVVSKLAEGMLASLAIFVLTLVFSLPLGLLLMFVRLSKVNVIRWIAKIYISIMRGTPLMLQVMAIYFGPYYLFGMSLSNSYRFYAVIIGFALNYAAYFAEIFRSGIQAIPAGQSEAATVLGYTRAQTFVRIILPQMTRIVLPPVTNEVITLVKDTSLAFALAYTEMFTLAKQIAAASASIMPLFIAGAFYYIFNFIVAWIMEYIEKKMRY